MVSLLTAEKLSVILENDFRIRKSPLPDLTVTSFEEASEIWDFDPV